MKRTIYAPRLTNSWEPLIIRIGLNFSGYRIYSQSVAVIKSLLLFTLLCLTNQDVRSQISVAGVPESYALQTKNAVVIPVMELNAINISKLIDGDKKLGIPNRYGVVQQLEIDIRSAGVKTEIPGKGYIWQYEISSPQSFPSGSLLENFICLMGQAFLFMTKNIPNYQEHLPAIITMQLTS